MGTICWGWGAAMLTGALSEWVLQLVAVLFWLPLLLWLLSSGALPAGAGPAHGSTAHLGWAQLS